MAADQLQLAIVAANTVTLVVGGFVTLLAFRAQRRTNSSSLRALSAGLGCITGGTMLGGLLHQSGFVPLLVGVTVHSISIAAGFLLLAWSLFGSDDAVFERRIPVPRDGS
jgi:hypothetical protein